MKTGYIACIRTNINIEHQSGNWKQTLGNNKYKRDIAFFSQLQTANINEDNDKFDLSKLVDWKLSNQSWFKKLFNNIDIENISINNISNKKMILLEVYNTKSNINILFSIKSTYFIEIIKIEDKIEYYNLLN